MAEVRSRVEGRIEQIDSDENGGVFITAIGAKIHFVPNRFGSNHSPRISSPTRRLIPLTVVELLDPTVLPGRTLPGFVGGTVVASGRFVTATNELKAESIQVAPEESLLLGALTRNDSGSTSVLSINGTPIVMSQSLTNTRLCFGNSKRPRA